eukprot:751105-Hanusia_phi.AAC.2
MWLAPWLVMISKERNFRSGMLETSATSFNLIEPRSLVLVDVSDCHHSIPDDAVGRVGGAEVGGRVGVSGGEEQNRKGGGEPSEGAGEISASSSCTCVVQFVHSRCLLLQAPDVQLSQIKELNDIANDDEHPDLLGWPASDKSEGEALQLAERPSAPHRSRTSSSQKKPTGDNREALALEMAETPSAPLDATSRDLMRDTQRRVSTRAARMSQLHSESRPAKAVKR